MSVASLKIQHICIFCGSHTGVRPSYAAAARRLAAVMAGRQQTLVYGAGGAGLMGELADAMLAAQGRVTGIIPWSLLQREAGHTNLTECIVVDTMHERKSRMADLADAFVMLPGGLGTLDEFFEILSWAQLGIHRKPIGVLNVDRYFDPLLLMLDHMVEQGFVQAKFRAMILVEATAEVLLQRLETYRHPEVVPWLARNQI